MRSEDCLGEIWGIKQHPWVRLIYFATRRARLNGHDLDESRHQWIETPTDRQSNNSNGGKEQSQAGRLNVGPPMHCRKEFDVR